MEICEQDFNMTTHLQELSHFYGRDGVCSVGTANGSSGPVDFQRLDRENFTDNVTPDDFLQI